MYTLKYNDFALALYEALLADPFYIELLRAVPGGDEARQHALMMYLDYSITEAEEYGRLFIPPEHDYGVSIWSKPLNAATETIKHQQKKDFLKHTLGQPVLDAYLEMTNFMTSKLDGLIAADAWYLSIVGIKPGFQGKGLGPGLINKVLIDIDKLSVQTYLETFTPRNIPFYNRLGYQSVASFTEPLTQAPYWILVRQPVLKQ